MIFDHIDNLKRYEIPKSEVVLNFIAQHDCLQLPDGEMEIEGRDLFVRIMSYEAKPAEDNRFEIHRVYADIQYMVSGVEIMQTARLNSLSALTDYEPRGDYQFFKPQGAISSAVVGAQEFAFFYPQEAHRPACAWEGYKGKIKKLVFKVKI